MSTNLDAIHKVVKEQTSEFKKYFIEIVKEDAKCKYDSLPKNIALLNDRLNEISCQLKEISKSYTNEYGGIISMSLFVAAGSKQRPLWKEQHKCQDLIRKYVKQIAMGKDSYVLESVNKAVQTFDSKVLGMAYKLDKKNFNPNEILFSNISNDPKLFDVYISSGNNKVHARSVLAAADSQCMIAHFRFIITNVKA